MKNDFGMRLVACRYAVVQFVPYSETGEFANVGVVLTCPETGYFDFRLLMHPIKRITDFFEALPPSRYIRSIAAIEDELRRVAHTLHEERGTDQGNRLRHAFESLIHPREALIRFSAPRVVMTDDPPAELQRKFDHYVERSSATPAR